MWRGVRCSGCFLGGIPINWVVELVKGAWKLLRKLFQGRGDATANTEFFNLSDRQRVAATMREAVRLLHEQKFYTAVVCLITAYIDALASLGQRQKKQERERRYLAFLDTHFPELCRQLGGSKVFYINFRHGMLHRFTPQGEFGLAENDEVDGAYVAEKELHGLRRRWLNADRLATDFIRLADSLAGDARPEGQ